MNSALNIILVVGVLGAMGIGGYFIVKKLQANTANAQGTAQTQPTGFDALLSGLGKGLASGDWFGSGYNSQTGAFSDDSSWYGA